MSAKVKDALLNKRFTDRQIGVAYDYLTRTDHDVMGGTHCITKENYPRLQRIKARWDPRDVFRHALSIRAG